MHCSFATDRAFTFPQPLGNTRLGFLSLPIMDPLYLFGFSTMLGLPKQTPTPAQKQLLPRCTEGCNSVQGLYDLP